MKLTSIVTSAALMMAASGATALVLQEPKAKGQPSQEDMNAMMERMMQAGQPGPKHKELCGLEGKWKAKNTSFMMGQTEVSDATAEFKAVLGGRYVVETVQGN